MFPFPLYNPVYDLKEIQHDSLFLAREFAKRFKDFHGYNLNPLMHTPVGRRLSASLILFERMTRDYPEPDFGIHETEINGKKVAVEEVVLKEKTFCRLLHFKKDGTFKDQPLKGFYLMPMSTSPTGSMHEISQR